VNGAVDGDCLTRRGNQESFEIVGAGSERQFAPGVCWGGVSSINWSLRIPMHTASTRRHHRAIGVYACSSQAAPPHRRTATAGVCEGCQAAMSCGIRQRGHPRTGPGASVWEWLRLGIGQHRQCQEGSAPETTSPLDALLSMRSTCPDSTVAKASFRLGCLAGDQIGSRVVVARERTRCWSASPCCFPSGPWWR
jgi:hypothetical protein